MPRPVVLAHRGLHATARENTVAALDAARRAGCDGAEFDVRGLADGTLVLHHDAHVGLGRRRVPLADLTLRRLRATAAGRRLSLLADALAWGARHPAFLLDVELKDAVAAAQTATLLAERLPRPTVATTFDPFAALALRRAAPKLRIGLITRGRDPTMATRMSEAGIDLAVLHAKTASSRTLGAAAEHGVESWVWGVRSVSAARRLVAGGVTAFIVDEPRRFVAWRDALGRGD